MMQAAIYGRLGRDPETRTTSNDNQMVTSSIAVDVTGHNAAEQKRCGCPCSASAARRRLWLGTGKAT